MDIETLKSYLIDIFGQPKDGWYSPTLNSDAIEEYRNNGGRFLPQLVNKNDPNKVIDINGDIRYNDYQRVNIPPRSKVSGSGKFYWVAPKDIIPYSPENKSMAEMVARNFLVTPGLNMLKKSPPLLIPYLLNKTAQPAY